jgi:adenosylcobinamide-GDP ribazoletransferase
MYYTRIPFRRNIESSAEDLSRATLLLPFIGLVVGGISALVYFAARFLFSYSVSLLTAMAVSVLLTGAFHEDGLADTFDGLGGAWTVQERLRIMKDSRIGTFGLTGLFFSLLLKLFLYLSLEDGPVVFALISPHVAGRMVPLLIIKMLPYVREDEESKARPVSRGTGSAGLIVSLLGGLLAVAGLQQLFAGGLHLLLCSLAAPLAAAPLIAWFYKLKLGGYTGDLLGAAEQFGELLLLSGIAALWPFTL